MFRLGLSTAALPSSKSNFLTSSISLLQTRRSLRLPLIVSLPRRKYGTAPSTNMSDLTASFLEATKARRTFYALEAKCPVPDSQIISLAEQALLNVPSPFNNQSTRMTVLLKSEHDKLW